MTLLLISYAPIMTHVNLLRALDYTISIIMIVFGSTVLYAIMNTVLETCDSIQNGCEEEYSHIANFKYLIPNNLIPLVIIVALSINEKRKDLQTILLYLWCLLSTYMFIIGTRFIRFYLNFRNPVRDWCVNTECKTNFLIAFLGNLAKCLDFDHLAFKSGIVAVAVCYIITKFWSAADLRKRILIVLSLFFHILLTMYASIYAYEHKMNLLHDLIDCLIGIACAVLSFSGCFVDQYSSEKKKAESDLIQKKKSEIEATFNEKPNTGTQTCAGTGFMHPFKDHVE